MRILLFIGILLFANDKYELYVKKLLNYHFNLPYNIKPPFEEKESKKKRIKKLKVYIDVKLLSILNKEALVEVYYYKNSVLVLRKKIWVKEGDKIEYCLVKKITLNRIYLICKNKMKIKFLNPSLNIKEKTW